jgi:hypothetical protein
MVSPGVMDREQRRAENEALFRVINEEIAQLGARFETDPLELVCECSDADCTARVIVPMRLYEEIRSKATQFVVVPGHETAGLERIVVRESGYCVVEKGGEAAAIAAATDPRG